jgi:Tfp pilus assembly PilM family ATPase/Tfp pilus assembly protein PilN
MKANQKRKAACAGIAITAEQISIAAYDVKTNTITHAVGRAMPRGVLSQSGDEVLDPGRLKITLEEAVQALGIPVKAVHLSMPATLLRITDLPIVVPALNNKQLYTALSSEAEQYKVFDRTNAVIDVFDLPAVQPNTNRLVFAAVREDTVGQYFRVLEQCKLKIASLDIEPFSVLRTMAGSGVMASLLQQIGGEGVWGQLFAEQDRVRIFLWKGDQLQEVRDIQMSTRQLQAEHYNAAVVQDFVEEIALSTKKLHPAIWLTYGLQEFIHEELTQATQTIFKPAFMGPGIAMQTHSNPFLMGAIGAALTSTVPLPIEFDFSSLAAVASRKLGKQANQADGRGASMSDVEAEGVEPPEWLPVLVGVVTALLLLAWGGMSLYQGYLNTQLQTAESQKSTLSSSIASLSQELETAKQQFAIQAKLLERAKQARIRCAVYENLAGDLRAKAPGQLWVHDLTVGDNLAIEGKALSHQAVLDFARSFDSVPYLKAVLINAMKEVAMSKKLVYDFKIGGNVHLDPTLVEKDTPTKISQATTTSKPHVPKTARSTAPWQKTAAFRRPHGPIVHLPPVKQQASAVQVPMVPVGEAP